MSEWRKVIWSCPDGHVAVVAFHGPADGEAQPPERGKPCPRCQRELQIYTFGYESAQDTPAPGRWRVYMADGTPFAVASVVELSEGQMNVAFALRRKEPRVDVGSRTWKEALDLADQWAEETLGHEPVPSTPWLRDEP